MPKGKINTAAGFISKPYQLRMEGQLAIKMLIISCALLNFMFMNFLMRGAIRFHLDCYFNSLILMGPSSRNPWAHFQCYINVELIIMETYNFRVGAALMII
jgi:hypothetical protein